MYILTNFLCTVMSKLTNPISDVVLKKHHEMIVMKPKKGKITLIGRRMYYLLVAYSQREMQGREPSATHLFEAPLRDILKIGASDGEEISVVKKYLREMKDFQVEWESTSQGDGVKWVGISMLSEVSLSVVNGHNWLSWAFPPTIMRMILAPERFSILNLKIITSISTYSGTALYDICSRYRNNPSGVTSRKLTSWWIDALSQTPSDVTKRREWRMFKYEKILPAIEEINQTTDITIGLIEEKKGKSVVEVQFSVRTKKLPHSESVGPIDVSKLKELEELANKLNISFSNIESLVRQYSDDLVMDKLKQVAIRVQNSTMSQIEDNHAYLRSIMANMNTKNNQDSKQDISTKIPNANSAVEVLQLQPNVPKPVSKLGQNISKMRDEINALPEEERNIWIRLGANSLRERGLFSKTDKKHSEMNTVVTGQLGTVVVQLYGRETYGEDLF